MDLLAIATIDCQVMLQRLIWHPINWQQLWSLSLEAAASALCWQPDGKRLAVGQADGSIAILSVEYGELVHRQNMHRAPVVAISWVEGHES